jgi:hypothetical protein
LVAAFTKAGTSPAAEKGGTGRTHVTASRPSEWGDSCSVYERVMLSPDCI